MITLGVDIGSLKGKALVLWDGHAAELIADILLRQETPEAGR